LVTGASSGIGAALVRALRAEDMAVLAVARRADRLAALAEETGCIPCPLDMRDVDALAKLTSNHPVDVLINNAGLGHAMTGLSDATMAGLSQLVDTNVTSVLHMLRLVLPGMRARGRGHVVNMGSVAGIYATGPAAYGASKGAIRLLSQNLRLELAGSGIRVTEICPGRVATEFYDAAVADLDARARLKNTGIAELTSEDVAEAVMYALRAPWNVNVATIELQPVEQTFGGVSLNPVAR
jgi:NADP-dependent 3-hydroxy acid dehydrogenase YdfG